MKNICFFLLCASSFLNAQNDKNKFDIHLFKTNGEENHFINKSSIDTKTLYLFIENNSLEKLSIFDNSEGKFLISQSSKDIFDKATRKTNKAENTVLLTAMEKSFVEELIIKKLQELEGYVSQNKEAFSYGDRNIEDYKNFNNRKNELIMVYMINSELSFQIGKDVLKDMTKLLQTELDHTLRNSVNLLAINF